MTTHPTTTCRCENTTTASATGTCDQPTRDGRYICDTCTTKLAATLDNIGPLARQLDINLARIHGIDYASRVGKATETPLPHDLGVSEATTHLKAVLVSWVLYSHAQAHASTDTTLPAETLPAMAHWLHQRINPITLDPLGPDITNQLFRAVRRCQHTINSPLERWYAGPCETCRTDLYANRREGTVTCDECGRHYDVAERRRWLLDAAEDRLATAAELARAVSWLGGHTLKVDRIYKWVQRGRITPRARDGMDRPLYRVGDAITLLAKDANKTDEKHHNRRIRRHAS